MKQLLLIFSIINPAVCAMEQAHAPCTMEQQLGLYIKELEAVERDLHECAIRSNHNPQILTGIVERYTQTTHGIRNLLASLTPTTLNPTIKTILDEVTNHARIIDAQALMGLQATRPPE